MKRIIFIILLVVVFCLTLCSCSQDDDDDNDAGDDDDDDDDDSFVGSWWIESVDEIAGTYQEFKKSSIATSLGGKPQILYFLMGQESVLKRALLADTQWIREVLFLDLSFIGFPSIELDSNNKAHFSIQQSYNNAKYDDITVLSYASNEAGIWVVDVVDSGGLLTNNLGASNSLAIDTKNNIHISYSSGGDGEGQYSRLNYINNVNGSWVNEGNDQCPLPELSSGGFSSIVLDSDDIVHIAHAGCDENNICQRYVTTNDGWHGECVPDTEYRVNQSSIAVDHDGRVFIAYNLDMSYKHIFSLHIGYKSEDEWTSDLIDPQISHLCRELSDSYLGLDGEGNAHIAYTGLDDEDIPVLKYATNASGEWVTEIVDPSPYSGIGASIAVDSEGYVHISYYDNGNSSLKYATNRP